MNIPEELKIYSIFYEYRLFVILPLYALWIAGCFYWLFRLKKIFFLWLLIFPLILSPLHTAFIYSGWHYRMELYNRFAKTPQGWHDIDHMPPEIRKEYAKHNYRPRQRTIKAMIAGTISFTPIMYAIGGLVFAGMSFLKKREDQKKS